MTRLWCNGQWMDPLDFPVSHSDRGLTLGLGLFETVLAIDGVPVFADRHLERFRSGCARLGWYPDLTGLESTMRELVALNELSTGRARLRLAITAGSGWLHDSAPGPDQVIWMSAVAAPEPPPATTVGISKFVRNERSAVVGLKCAAYAENALALVQAVRAGDEETLFFNTAGHLCEAATANVFLVRNGQLLTPPVESGCLPGITREVVMELAARVGIPCAVRDLTAADLDAADEVFLTSSIRGVMGVSRLQGRSMPESPVTGRLRADWNSLLSAKNSGPVEVPD
jgi:branched-chain amino acid aminotransferase